MQKIHEERNLISESRLFNNYLQNRLFRILGDKMPPIKIKGTLPDKFIKALINCDKVKFKIYLTNLSYVVATADSWETVESIRLNVL